jgi:nucleoside-diphosphate-sugar epimerase
MPLIYVTGISGSGKSSVLEELRSRGLTAYGVDEDRYGRWLDRASGARVELPPGMQPADLHEWYADHEWVLDIEKIAELKERSDRGNETVFLCGVAAGDAEAWNYFDVVCALVVDGATIRQRIELRPDAYGKRSVEMTQILMWNADYENRYRGFGAVIIDATQQLNAVTDAILIAAGAESL